MQIQRLIGIATLLVITPIAMAAKPQFEITLAGHEFTPTEITIPADTKVTLVVHNKDDSAEEFHSDSLGREKIIGPKMSGKINIGPLKPGVYSFMGEFNARTAQGKVIVK
jgi:heme/copper-type cytochrome/quinol oxidase subunit 2